MFALTTLTACVGGSEPSGRESPEPSGTSGGDVLGEAALKYRLIDEFGAPQFCDRDAYPVARGDETALALDALPAIRADRDTFAAIADRLAIEPGADVSDAVALSVFREHKALSAVQLEPSDGGYRFEITVADGPQPEGGTSRFSGFVDTAGAISGTEERDAGPLNCPICLARGTLIDTPAGPIPVELVTSETLVWTSTPEGGRVAASVVAVAETVAPPQHAVIELVLDDGRELHASPRHPLADGRLLHEIARGDLVDGATVVAARTVPYGGSRTYDLLPSGGTGVYWADGVPLASTLSSATRRFFATAR